MRTPHVYLCVGAMAMVAAVSVRAQSIAAPAAPMSSTATQSVNGFVKMSSGLSVDGGVSTTTLTAGSVQADFASFGTLSVDGGTAFTTRPTGVVLSGTLTRASALNVGQGCAVLGTAAVNGALPNDACSVTGTPSEAQALGMVFDCWALASNVVTVRACGLVTLVAAPAGKYAVRVVGP